MNIKSMLLEMLNIYSPSGSEQEIAKLLQEYMVKLDFEDPVIDNKLNVVSVNGNGKPSIFLCGHEDTVPGILEVKSNGNIVYGRGAVDAKSSLLALILGAKKAMDYGYKGKFLISAASGEESDSKGINNILETHEKYDFAVFGEPGGSSNITAGYKGRMLVKVESRSETHHASSAWMNRNAIDTLIDFWDSLRKKYGNNKDFNSITAGVTKFNGGEYDNMTPEHASMFIDIRYPKAVSEEYIVNELKQHMLELNIDNYSFNIENRTYPYISDMKSTLVTAFKDAISSNGMTPKLIFKSGSGDMNTLGHLWNIPAITYGPGDTQMSHTQNEFVDIKDIERCINVISDSMLMIANNR